jgi:hypothetical protein
MVIRDPSKFGLLATQVKLDLIQAAQATVNIMAGRGRKEAIKNVQAEFTNRNNFTVRQIQFTPMMQSKYIKISAIQSTLGVTTRAGYMERQEKGGARKPASGDTLSIPTNVARGGNKNAPVIKSKYLSKLKKVKAAKNKSKLSYRAGLVARAAVAYSQGRVMRHNNALFAVTNFVKKDGKVFFELKEVYNLDKKETLTPATPWLLPASEKVAAQAQNIFNSQMKKFEK